MPTRLTQVVIDALDWQGLARFWAEALNWDFAEDSLVDGEAIVRRPDGGGIELICVPTDRPKEAKNRLHLDLSPTGSQHSTVEFLLGLGARSADIGQGDVPWVVMADPEGNEFCVMPESVADDALAAICLDAADPSTQGPFWAAATGWTIEAQTADFVALRAPDGTGPALVMGPKVAPKSGKNRLHMDVAPFVDDDHSVEVERLIRLRAHHVDIAQGDVPWVVLADPEDNELCVLTPR
jgi:hypothetical protein